MLLSGLLFVFLTADPVADKGSNLDKIVGTWIGTIMIADAGYPLIYEFNKDGTYTRTTRFKEADVKHKGTYKVEKAKLIMIHYAAKLNEDITETMTIKELTTDTLLMHDGKQETKFQKKK